MATFFTTLPKTLTLTLVSSSQSKPNPKKASPMQGQKPTPQKPRKKIGVRSMVFDTGVHGLGERMGTRMIDPQPLIFDHATQFFIWQGVIGELEVGGQFVHLPFLLPRYICVNGMHLLTNSIFSIWTILAAFEDSLPIAFEGDFKLLHSLSSGPYCQTFLNTTTFGKRNKVPQENIPTITLWGATLSTNTPGIPCIFYPHGRVGICDDWLMGSILEAVSLNNIALANHGELVTTHPIRNHPQRMFG
ncbi:hypothetical protein PVL29_015668 [Vitis rotundifolia]|uniref:Uncharacterized protein n=1 Tax=Vitis rotundifolia TaxID=103349 RepID=A0AA39DJ89_VITRO|nr:hypothetical protein PVL29_015668 [Vitis rotundifolia]